MAFVSRVVVVSSRRLAPVAWAASACSGQRGVGALVVRTLASSASGSASGGTASAFTGTKGSGPDIAGSNNLGLADLVISNRAAQKLQALRNAKKDGQLKLRVLVDNGGCAGYTYNYNLTTESAKEDDKIFEKDGVQVLVDEISMPFLIGATLDWENSLIKEGFAIVNNPQATKGCGCGTSFAVKLD